MSPLASQRTGFTTESQPTLRWYISGSWPGKIEFTLNESGAVEPVLETYIEGPADEGIYRISLSDYNISLKPNVEYEWFLVIVPDPEERSADFLGSATIQYIEPSDTLSNRLKNAKTEELHYVYAEEGYWYDAIEKLSKMIEEQPGNTGLRASRAALLKQENLPLAAAYDSKMISN
jgi:hypothetical protein